jgi:hypothetical protein
MTSIFNSSRKPIQLYHSYYNIFPIDVTPDSATTITEAILFTLFVLDNSLGNTLNELVDTALSLFPTFSREQLCDTILEMLRVGILKSLYPICRDHCLTPNNARISTITWSEKLDQYPANSSLVEYLIGLAGGTREYSQTFTILFKPYINPTLYENTVEATGMS